MRLPLGARYDDKMPMSDAQREMYIQEALNPPPVFGVHSFDDTPFMIKADTKPKVGDFFIKEYHHEMGYSSCQLHKIKRITSKKVIIEDLDHYEDGYPIYKEVHLTLKITESQVGDDRYRYKYQSGRHHFYSLLPQEAYPAIAAERIARINKL